MLTDEIGANFDLPTVASYTATQNTDVSATRWSGSGTASTFTLSKAILLRGYGFGGVRDDK